MSEQRENQKEEQETLKKQRKGDHEAEKGAKKLKLSSCRPKSIKSRPNSPVTSTSNDGVIRCLTAKRNIVTLQQKNGSSVVNAKSSRMRNVPIIKMAFLFVIIVSCTTSTETK
ncbi:hypothetical protein TNCV_44371 [Trichonephila clavipes]|nr:hypothetical protein TNCV_44371 [Trichonephila clavipes]